ncbi:MAG: sulfide/dihydroorotate dehydrogenase-like FAD/NAD-binding protein, partial [Prevotella sp.]|nr:sulfide/dihydroorotate dehydrogenase-like FAD/NAD-binding protein [Prevotella sp.]
MNKIVRKEQFSEKVFLFEIEAPLIAQSRKAGNFVIVRVDKKGERMPLTIAGADKERGTITLVVQQVGLSSKKLCLLNEGEYVADVVGPLGNPTHIENFGTVVCAGGGLGVAPMLPIIQALKAAGNRVLSVMAGRSKDLIILEDKVRESSDEVIIMTDDGSYGEKGVVTVGIEKFIEQEHVDKVFAIGPPIMMKFSNLTAQKHNIPCEVSLNTIMVDGTGMCGACRLTIGGKTKFVCIDGPEFDGALVDWDEMFKRMGTFKREEQEEIAHFEEHLDSVNDSSAIVTKTTDVVMDDDPTNDTIEVLTEHEAEWRKALRASMKPKERTQIERVVMPELDPVYRATTRTEEVNIGLTKEMAMQEAKRCLDCAKPSCMEGCPVNIDIPSFIKNIERGQFLAAAK